MEIPQRGGLPHSDIHGSKPARGSPWLFAACHVLHRLLVPRHPPNALIALDINARQITPTGSPPCAGTIHTRVLRSKISIGFYEVKSPEFCVAKSHLCKRPEY